MSSYLLLLSGLKNTNIPNVRFYEGIKGIEGIYDDIILTSQHNMNKDYELSIISSGKDLIKVLPDHYNHFIKKRIHRGIPVRILAPDNSICRKLFRTSETHLRTGKFFDEKLYEFQIEINIYGSKIALISYSNPVIIGTVIDSATISDSMKSIFRML